MEAALIAAMVFVFIVLVIGAILTISVANKQNKEYDSNKSFSSLLWVYVLSVPFTVVLTVVAIYFFA